MQRTLAIIEREMRRFRRSPQLMIMSMIMPIMQLVVLGNAFGGNVKHVKVGVVDQDRGVPAVRIRELASAAASGSKVVDIVQEYADQGVALADLRNGRINGVLTIPPDFSRRVLARSQPQGRADRGQHRHRRRPEPWRPRYRACWAPTISAGPTTQRISRRRDARRGRGLPARALHPSICCRASVVMSIFMMVMIGGGIMFIDDKARGLHEGYLVTPITKFERIAGFNIAGTIKAVLAGTVIMIIGSFIAGIPNPLALMRIVRLEVVIVVTAFALISMMFLLMVRVNDPMMPRMMFGLLNTVLYFPSGAVYPQQGFPGWMKVIAAADPFTYAVHAFKSLLLKNTGFEAISGDLLYLVVFSVIMMSAATMLFKRQL